MIYEYDRYYYYFFYDYYHYYYSYYYFNSSHAFRTILTSCSNLNSYLFTFSLEPRPFETSTKPSPSIIRLSTNYTTTAARGYLVLKLFPRKLFRVSFLRYFIHVIPFYISQSFLVTEEFSKYVRASFI